MAEPAKPKSEIVSIPVEKLQATAEATTVGAVEDEDVIPVNSEAAKVDVDPKPEISTTPEEPKSVAETVAQKAAIADVTGEDEDDVVLREGENKSSSATV